MLARMNFLFSISILALLLFYFAVRFVFVPVISAVAPAVVPYFIAAYVLSVLMLTVLGIAKVVMRLNAASSAARTQRVAIRGIGAQVVLCLAHVCVLYALLTLFETHYAGATWWLWLGAPALYTGGIILFVTDMQQRALRPTF